MDGVKGLRVHASGPLSTSDSKLIYLDRYYCHAAAAAATAVTQFLLLLYYRYMTALNFLDRFFVLGMAFWQGW